MVLPGGKDMNYQPTTWQWQSLAGAGGRRNSQGVFVEEDVYLPIKIRPFYCSSIVWSGDIPSSVEEQYGKCNFFQLCLLTLLYFVAKHQCC